MNQFYHLLSKEHSKTLALSIVSSIKKEPALLHDLMECFFSDEYRMCQRASWPMEIIADKYADLLEKYIPTMFQNGIEQPKHDAILRNSLRTFAHLEFNDDLEGEIYSFCFKASTSLNHAIAIRAFALKICVRIAMKYPDLQNEVKELLIILSNDQAPGIVSVVKQGERMLKNR